MEASCFLRSPGMATVVPASVALHPGRRRQHSHRCFLLSKPIAASVHPSEENARLSSTARKEEPWRRTISSTQCPTPANTESSVMDGERGNEYRRGLLPSYKEKRNKYKPLSGVRGPYFKGDQMDLRDAFPHITSFLMACNVPVIKLEDAEADDVIATLMQQAVNKGMKVVIASPDMDYRQLLSHKVKMVLPLPEFGRWSFYTLQQYVSEHDCDPSIDLGLRCMLGDQSDNVPGLQEWSTGFGRKTALKLMKKHGSLENLLIASQTRTVGKPYIQEALATYRDALYRNLRVLSLRRDLDITLEDEWLRPRDRSNEAQAFKQLRQTLQGRSSYARK